jgi:hypothetical protein
MNFCKAIQVFYTRTFTLEFQWIMRLKIKVFCMFGRVLPLLRRSSSPLRVRLFALAFMVLPWPAKS